MNRTRLTMAVLMFLVVSACAGAEVQSTPSVTMQAAPDFTLADQDGKLWKLSDTLKDYRAVVLAFYPKDDTGV